MNCHRNAGPVAAVYGRWENSQSAVIDRRYRPADLYLGTIDKGAPKIRIFVAQASLPASFAEAGWKPALLPATEISHLAGKSRAKCARLLKSEIRISNLETNRKFERRKKYKPPASRLLLFELSALMLFRISSFEIRISRRSFWFRLRRVRCAHNTAIV
jgi:hypothetical protein